jgi:hypothetical protein
MEKCANCDRVIGKLETPAVWRDEVVCAGCHEILAKQPAAPAPKTAIQEWADGTAEQIFERPMQSPTATIERPAAKAPAAPLGYNEIICPNPNCGYIGPAIRRNRGNMVVALLLMLLFVVPGLFYALFTSGYDYFCPRCNMKLRTEHR